MDKEKRIFIDTASNFHPYECGGNCIHCNKTLTSNHNPDQCALCYYNYDITPSDIADIIRSEFNRLKNTKDRHLIVARKILENFSSRNL